MNLYTFIVIVALKFLAIQVVLFGIYLQYKHGCPAWEIIITVGSLIFAIASNTTLFLYAKYSRNKRRDGD